jgi:hypothetical protein
LDLVNLNWAASLAALVEGCEAGLDWLLVSARSLSFTVILLALSLAFLISRCCFSVSDDVAGGACAPFITIDTGRDGFVSVICVHAPCSWLLYSAECTECRLPARSEPTPLRFASPILTSNAVAMLCR